MGKIHSYENGEIVSDDKAIAECLNCHFVSITDSLGLNASFKSSETDSSVDDSVDMAIDKYKSHPSITNINGELRCTNSLNLAMLVCLAL